MLSVRLPILGNSALKLCASDGDFADFALLDIEFNVLSMEEQ